MQTVQSFCSELPSDVEVIVSDVYPLDVNSAIAAAKKLEQNCDIILCRGGTRNEIMASISVPMVEIPYTLGDILNALYMAKEKGKHIALILARSSNQDLGPWPKLLGIEVTKVLVDHHHEIAPAVKVAMEDKAVVVGGSVQVMYASQMGVESQYIVSSRETIRQSLNRAIEIVRTANKEKERSARLQALLNFAHEGIIFLESDNKVGYLNKAATEILKIPNEQMSGKNFADILRGNGNDVSELDDAHIASPITGRILKLNGLSIMANLVPVRAGEQTVGKVITFFEASRLQSLEHNFRRQMARRTMTARFNLDDIIGTSQALEIVKQQARTYSATDSTVAIYGESGVGKELFAQSIHNLSSRKSGPFVAINCSALPKELMESELFGYEEGAFTGAKKGGKEGLFELAHGGSLFLDEIGTMPLELQSKILRVIQEREVTRLGGTNLIPVNVRIIVATNRNLREAVQKGEFRQDLFFRLSVLPLTIPPLRDRTEDIPLLMRHFLGIFGRKIGQSVSLDDLHTTHLLQGLYWPGNVRELENFCERFVVMAGYQNNKDELLKELLQESESQQNIIPAPRQNPTAGMSWKDTWNGLEKNVLEQMLNESGITKTVLAKSLGISRTALWKKLKESPSQTERI
jgi:transcriptional regulator with PAS, ATPase and Fis domain